MKDKIRTIPTTTGYPGLAEITRDGRTYVCMGPPELALAAIRERMERK